MESGSRYKSRVDHEFGKSFVRGYEYMARLQAFDGNPTLCPTEGPDSFNMTHAPPDQLPGERCTGTSFVTLARTSCLTIL